MAGTDVLTVWTNHYVSAVMYINLFYADELILTYIRCYISWRLTLLFYLMLYTMIYYIILTILNLLYPGYFMYYILYLIWCIVYYIIFIVHKLQLKKKILMFIWIYYTMDTCNGAKSKFSNHVPTLLNSRRILFLCEAPPCSDCRTLVIYIIINFIVNSFMSMPATFIILATVVLTSSLLRHSYFRWLTNDNI